MGVFNDIKHCVDWQTVKRCKNYNHKLPLWMTIPKKCRIMMVSQAPSGPASNKQILADKTNRTFLQVLKILDINETTFKKYVYWTHYAKCYPGAKKGGDEIPTIYCADKYLRAEFDLCKPKFVLGVGGCASRFVYSKFVEPEILKTRVKFKNIRNKPITRNGIVYVFIKHPSAAAVKTQEDIRFVTELLLGLIRKAIKS